MPFLTDGLPSLALFTGKEEVNVDTYASSGAIPQSEKLALYKQAMVLTTMMNSLNKTMVNGTIYYSQFFVGSQYTPVPSGAVQSQNSFSITGVNVPIGSTGGTDTWHVALYNSAGVRVARSITAGVTAGTALTIQQIPFYGNDGTTLAPVTITSGTYYIALQSNGNTATFKDINSPIWPLATGSQIATAGTLVPIASPATTYTADVGPLATLY